MSAHPVVLVPGIPLRASGVLAVVLPGASFTSGLRHDGMQGLKSILSLMLTTFLAGASSLARPAIIAHRGASETAPENTLAAFRQAWEEGADGIEGDFRLTTDGEVVCIHDADTKRVAGKSLDVETSTWAELSALDVGRWKHPRFAGEKIPRLHEVLDLLPSGKRFFLEIKSGVRIVGPIAKILREKKADPGRVVLISFDAAVVAACRETLPDYQAHWISDLKDARDPAKAAAYAAELKRCGGQGLQFDCRTNATAEWLASLHLPLASWTVNDVATAKKVIALGVGSLTTNRPGGLRKELDKDK